MLMVVVVLTSIVILFIVYHVILQRQLHNMNKQLDKRLAKNTRQPLSIELFNKELSNLAINMNKCLKVEENLRLNSIREEKRFKELIAYISHDLRTPLAAIKGYQQLIEKEGLSEEQHKKMKTAQKHADELERLIHQFFEYSYLLNSESKPNRERINITNFLMECLVTSIAVFEERKLSVKFEEQKPIFAFADKEMLTRIIQNLISNCTAHSSGDIVVQVIAEETAVISFRNPLSNPSEVDIGHLFDCFYTADKARSKTTGLGLTIVKELAEQMGGQAKAILQENMLEIRVELPLYGHHH
ncbi:HAMP domain-containing histidine kinase [Bacillus sp. Bva_UNVM-123]|uniref:histidine kinase dimerization/phospho-acceptor domain-containing protein n=1 Tax=Bacillus sp. Bva_UNVM-123 TaxID=2829798 RepID=UPI00391F6CE8